MARIIVANASGHWPGESLSSASDEDDDIGAGGKEGRMKEGKTGRMFMRLASDEGFAAPSWTT